MGILLLLIILLSFYLGFAAWLLRGIDSAPTDSSNSLVVPSVSVIVAVRNSRSTIAACLKSLFDQHYPATSLQIIMVDDRSTDGTYEFLERLRSKRPFLLLRNLTENLYSSSKKAALQTAIAEARGELLFFTDADCTPPPNWVRNMSALFTENIGLVAGFSPQVSDKGLWNGLLLCDSAAAAVAAAGTIGWGRGVTCAGRNLAYRKQAYHDVGGFAVLPNSLSGDDDFMLQRIADHPRWGVRYALDPQTVVPARGPQNLRLFLRQKHRHLSAGRHYSTRRQWGYGLFHAANFALWLCAGGGAILDPLYLLPLALKVMIDVALIRRFLRRFYLAVAWHHFLLWEPLYLFYHVYAGVAALLKKPRWN